ncbi:MAG: hypothetical protein H6531_06065 [Actinobacteria bacterium]|nr:hypothetical protein [Thermoleophilia bacterium]MCB9011380.1 hypothetical protein [Actinomycetota bacterium]
MPDSALLVTIGVAAIAIAIGTWNAAANSDDRAPLLVLLGVAVPSLLAIGAIGGANAGPLPLVVGLVGALALAPGAVRLALHTRGVRRDRRETDATPAAALATGFRKAA